MKQLACPIALHPDGAPQRIAVFEHPRAGWQLVKGGLHAGETPAAAAARALYKESGLETRAALSIGQSDTIQDGVLWHFVLCRLAPPVRDRWQHLCADDGAHLFRFNGCPLRPHTPTHSTLPTPVRSTGSGRHYDPAFAT